VTTASGTWFGPSGLALVVVVGPETDVDVESGAAAACVVAEVAVGGGEEAADLVVDDPATGCFGGAAGRATTVVAVVAAAIVVVVDGLEGPAPAVEVVVVSTGGMATGLAGSPLALQAATNTRTPRAALRKRMGTNHSVGRPAGTDPTEAIGDINAVPDDNQPEPGSRRRERCPRTLRR
jgi:hypothetical protein